MGLGLASSGPARRRLGLAWPDGTRLPSATFEGKPAEVLGSGRPTWHHAGLVLDLDDFARYRAKSRRSSALQRGEHGLAAYGQGCRCRSCRSARRAYDRAWRGARQVLRTGELRRLVHAGPAAGHLTALLAAGWTVQAVADEVPCGHATLDRILLAGRRGRGRCWSTIADRLAELAELAEVVADTASTSDEAEVTPLCGATSDEARP